MNFTHMANAVSVLAGKPATFLISVTTIGLWIITGPMFGFSDTWQLIINTGTTIITFLMVFLIQNTQNRNEAALHLKLDELIRAVDKANNKFRGIEVETEEELEELKEQA